MTSVPWHNIALMDLCRPKQWPTISSSQLTSTGYPVYGANGRIGYYSEYNHDKATILVTCRGATCGTVTICEPFSYVTGNSMALDDMDEERAFPRFVYYALVARGFRDAITGSAQPQITRESLRRVSLPLPPLPEQRRIADILDKADAVRRKRKEAIALTEELLRSAFLEMFGDPVTNPKGWPGKTLGEVSELYAGNSLPTGVPFEGQRGGVLLLKVGDMNLPGNEVSVATAREWAADASGGVVAPAGAVVIPKRGGAIATNKKRVLLRPAVLDPNLMAIAPIGGLSLHYLRVWFDLLDLATLSNGSAVPQLNKKDLAPLDFPMPPMSVQVRFGAVANQVEAVRKRAEAGLKLAENLFESLTMRVFRGELTRSTVSKATQLEMFADRGAE